jgi:hypothetical protein
MAAHSVTATSAARAMSSTNRGPSSRRARDVGGGVVTGSYPIGVAAEKGCETVAQQTFGADDRGEKNIAGRHDTQLPMMGEKRN